MKVAVITDRIPATQGGGSTLQQDVLSAVLDLAPASGHELRVVDTGSQARSRLSRALKVFAPGLVFAARTAGLRSSLDRRLADWGPDLVWFLTPIFLDTDLPYFYPVWDLQHRRQPWFPEVSSRGRWALRETMYREAIQRAAVLIVPNGTASQEVQTFYGVLPERCLQLAQPTPAFALGAGEPAPATAKVTGHLAREFVVYPAQFWPHKNHTTLLKALRMVRDSSGREIHAVFPGSDAGNGSHVRSTASLLGVDGQVHFPGFVSRDDLVHLYRRALALVFPSHFGPENLPPLEAMALGCPVIAADVPGSREQLGDAALFAEPLAADAWATALMAVATQPDTRDRLVAAGRVRARSWTAGNYAQAVFAAIGRFARVRDCWQSPSGN